MGVSVFLVGMFVDSSWPEAPVRESHRALRRAGFESAPDRPPEVVEYGRDVLDREYGTVEEVARELRAETGDDRRVFYGYADADLQTTDELRVTHRSGPGVGDRPMPVGLSGLDGRWFDPERTDPAVADRRADVLADAFLGLSTALDPEVAFLMLFNDHGTGAAAPDSRDPTEHGLEALPFLLLLSEPWIEHCGGREHVGEAPVYGVQTLDTGSVAVRAARRPDPRGCHHETGFDHLFGD